MAAYKELSYYYDSLMDPDFYSDYLKFIHEHADLKTVLELGSKIQTCANLFIEKLEKLL